MVEQDGHGLSKRFLTFGFYILLPLRTISVSIMLAACMAPGSHPIRVEYDKSSYHQCEKGPRHKLQAKSKTLLSISGVIVP